MTRVFILIISILIIPSCTRWDRPETPNSGKFLGIVPYDQLKPRAYREQMFDNSPNDGDSYSEGYKAGCQTMTSAMGSGFYRLRGPKLDPEKLSTDPWYLRGYSDAASVCTFNLDWETH